MKKKNHDRPTENNRITENFQIPGKTRNNYLPLKNANMFFDAKHDKFIETWYIN
jgi:hypothetical protein